MRLTLSCNIAICDIRLIMGNEAPEENAMSYIEKNGTSYHPHTATEVVTWLETSRARRQPIRVFYGDTATGEVWSEENDVWGVVGRSMGPVKIPLLMHPRAQGGPGMLEHCIVGIVTRGSDGRARFVYRHPALDLGIWRAAHDGDRWAAFHNGGLHARFDNQKAARRYVDFMTGKRVAR